MSPAKGVEASEVQRYSANCVPAMTRCCNPSKRKTLDAGACRTGACRCGSDPENLALAQEAGDLVTAVATGSTSGARNRRWVRRLASAAIVLVAFDSDEAGETAAGWWLDALPGARRWAPEGDPAGMLEADEDVREWMIEGLRA